MFYTKGRVANLAILLFFVSLFNSCYEPPTVDQYYQQLKNTPDTSSDTLPNSNTPDIPSSPTWEHVSWPSIYYGSTTSNVVSEKDILCAVENGGDIHYGFSDGDMLVYNSKTERWSLDQAILDGEAVGVSNIYFSAINGKMPFSNYDDTHNTLLYRTSSYGDYKKLNLYYDYDIYYGYLDLYSSGDFVVDNIGLLITSYFGHLYEQGTYINTYDYTRVDTILGAPWYDRTVYFMPIYKLGSDVLCKVSSSELYLYTGDTYTLIEYFDLHTVREMSNGDFIAFNSTVVKKYVDGKWETLSTPMGAISITDYFVDSRNNIWVGAKYGLWQYDGADWIDHSSTIGKDDEHVGGGIYSVSNTDPVYISEDSYGNIQVATDNGLYIQAD